MFKTFFRHLALLLFVTIVHGESAAQPRVGPEEKLKPATQADLNGVWRQVAVATPHADADLSDPWYSGVQYFSFPSPGKMKNLGLTGTQANTPLDEKTIAIWNVSPAAWSYEMLPQGGGAILKHTDTPPQLVRFRILSDDMDATDMQPRIREKYPLFIPKRGDLYMTYYFPDTSIRFMRLLRRYTAPK